MKYIRKNDLDILYKPFIRDKTLLKAINNFLFVEEDILIQNSNDIDLICVIKMFFNFYNIFNSIIENCYVQFLIKKKYFFYFHQFYFIILVIN